MGHANAVLRTRMVTYVCTMVALRAPHGLKYAALRALTRIYTVSRGNLSKMLRQIRSQTPENIVKPTRRRYLGTKMACDRLPNLTRDPVRIAG